MIKQLKSRYAVGVASFIVIAIGCAVAYHKMGPYHFRIVESGALYRSGMLQPDELRNVIDQYGIRTVVALCCKDENDPVTNWYVRERGVCREKSVQFVYLPMQGPPAPEQVEQWRRILKNRKAEPVLVHCAQGAVRTGAMIAIYQMEVKGMRNLDAIENQPHFGHEIRGDLRRYLLNYRPFDTCEVGSR